MRSPGAEPQVLPQELPVQGRIPVWPQIRLISFSLSPDGSYMAVTGDDGSISVLDLQNPGSRPVTLEQSRPNRTPLDIVYSVRFSPDNMRLAAGTAAGVVRVWNLRSPASAPLILDGHQNAVDSLAFSADGTRLVSGGSDGTVRVWDLMVPSSEPIVLSGHRNAVVAVSVSPDGSRIASGGEDTVLLWDLRDSNPPVQLRILQAPSDASESRTIIALSPDARWLARSIDSMISVWDLRMPDGQPRVFHGPEGNSGSLSFTPDSAKLAFGGNDGSVRVWDLRQAGT